MEEVSLYLLWLIHEDELSTEALRSELAVLLFRHVNRGKDQNSCLKIDIILPGGLKTLPLNMCTVASLNGFIFIPTR